MKYVKEKVAGILGSLSGVTSILGSWQICHNICLGLIAILSIIGITITGMPLLFLTKIAIPLWAIALSLLILTIILYIKKKCILKGLIILNTGLIIAGIPFQQIQDFTKYFWITGGFIFVVGIIIIIKDNRRKYEKKKK